MTPQISESEDIGDWIVHHLVNRPSWHPLPGVDIPLPETLRIGTIDLSITLHVLMLWVGALITFLLFAILYRKKTSQAPHGLTNLLETLVLFVRDQICIEYLGEEDGRKLAPFFLNFFFFILILNLMGLIPIFASATANINVTAGFALITVTMMIAGGVIRHGPWGFLKIFMPPGLPIFVYFILTPIEMLGLIIKPMALTIRLFANMLAGHIVIAAFISLIIGFKIWGLPFLGGVVFVYALELLVAFIQAYIFTLLSAMFLGSMLHPEHE